MKAAKTSDESQSDRVCLPPGAPHLRPGACTWPGSGPRVPTVPRERVEVALQRRLGAGVRARPPVGGGSESGPTFRVALPSDPHTAVSRDPGPD